MNVSELRSLALKKMGYANHDLEHQDVLLDHSPELLLYLNEAYFRAFSRLRPLKRQEVVLDGERGFALEELEASPTRIRYIEHKGVRHRQCLPYDRDMQRLTVFFAKPWDSVAIGYEYDPPALENDWDEPQIRPAFFHSALADYAAARALEQEGKREDASQLYAAFERALALLKPAAGRFHGAVQEWKNL